MLEWILLFSILGSIGALTMAAGFLLLNEKIQKQLVSILLAYATGTLLTAALLGLIPEAIETTGNEPHGIMIFVLGSIVFFFFLEKLVIWRNCSDEMCDVHGKAAGPIVLVGDAFHNFTDGIVIAAAFLTNFSIGIAVGISIIIHEVPQETGDFGILLYSGFTRKKAYYYNVLSSSFTIIASIISYFILEAFHFAIPYILAISAASFLYIALSDLTPELHQKFGFKHTARQLLLILAGIFTMLLLFSLGIHAH